jgi:hypothetical protein
MNTHLKTTGLFLTPRGPYGRRLPERARHHLRASEDEKPDPTSQGMQGLGGQMAPNALSGAPGESMQIASARYSAPNKISGQIQNDHLYEDRIGVPTSLSGQLATNSAGGKDNQAWQTPDTRKEQNESIMQRAARRAAEAQRLQSQMLPQKMQQAAQSRRDSWAQSGSDPATYNNGERAEHVEGSFGAEGGNRFKPDSVEGEIGLSFPRAMNSTFDPFIRGILPKTKKRSGKPFKDIDKRVPQYYAEPPQEGYPRTK